MPRFVIASRRAISRGRAQKAADAARTMLDTLRGNVDIVSEQTRTAGRPQHLALIETDSLPRSLMARAARANVIMEPEILHTQAAPLQFVVHGSGFPLPDADLLAVVRDPRGTYHELMASTNADGIATFPLDDSGVAVESVFTMPRSRFWARFQLQMTPGATVECDPLDAGPLGWWHELLNHSAPGSKGTGVRIGIADSGVGPNRCLSHVVDFGSILDGRRDLKGGADINGHGTHVAGLIGARPLDTSHFSGLAPDSQLASVRIFRPYANANQFDIANALELLGVEFEADVINLSFAAPAPSQVEHDAIKNLRDAGVICVCAAGNHGDHVRWPAAFPEVVAVAAIGRLTPEERRLISTDTRIRSLPPRSDTQDWGINDLYLAAMSCRGRQIFCAAPGIGIISTAPHVGDEVAFAGKDGTSMASPLACAVLARQLSNDSTYLRLPKGRRRHARAIALLKRCCRPAGLARAGEGHGVPQCGSNVRGTPISHRKKRSARMAKGSHRGKRKNVRSRRRS